MRYAALYHSDHVHDSNLCSGALYVTPRESISSFAVRVGCRDYLLLRSQKYNSAQSCLTKALKLHSKLIIPFTHCILLH